MSKPTTHVLLVTDMSGSMALLADDVRGGYNTYLDGLAADHKVKYRVTSAVFHTSYRLLDTAAKVRVATRLDDDNYRPGGGTALLDAIGKTITDFEARVPQLGDDERVLLVVQTDGQENSSREYRPEMVRKMIADREEGGRWSCIYLGVSPNAWGQGERLGFAAAQSINLPFTGASTRATYDSMTVATRAYSRGATGAQTSKVIADATGGDGAASQ